MTLRKPPHGQPCNSCGTCCRIALCPLATHLFDRIAGPCPAIERDGQQQVCGLVRNPGNYAVSLTMIHGRTKMSAAAALLIGAGVGCDALEFGEKPDFDFSIKLRRSAPPKHKVDAAMARWGVSR